MWRPIISLILILCFFSTQSGLAEVAQLNLSGYLHQGPKLSQEMFRPPVLRYFSYDTSADNYQLLLDPGSLKDKLSEDETKGLAQEQLDYFLVGLTLPNSKFWVNLRPDAPDNIIEPELEQTEVGRIMLAADLQLKKDTASFTSPQSPEGRVYWDKLYEKARELFGSEPANIPTITRPWIVPGEIILREAEGAAYVYKATLKVMLEEDYLERTENRLQRTDHSFKDSRMKELNVYSSQLIRELILPKLTQEVNSGKNYAQLRQVYFSLVLSRWFKARFGSQKTEDRGQKTEQAKLSQLIDSGKLDGLTSKQPWSKETYFKEYQKSFSQGEYNLKEQVTTPTGQVIRSYVSGGSYFGDEVFKSATATFSLLPFVGVSNSLSITGDVVWSAVFIAWGLGWYYLTYKVGQLLQRRSLLQSLSPGFDYNFFKRLVKKLKEAHMDIPKVEDKLSYYYIPFTKEDLALTNSIIPERPGCSGCSGDSGKNLVSTKLMITKQSQLPQDIYTISLLIVEKDNPSEKKFDVLRYSLGEGIKVLEDFGDLPPFLGLNIRAILEHASHIFDVPPSSNSSPLTPEQAKEDIMEKLTVMEKISKAFTDYKFFYDVDDDVGRNAQSIIEGMKDALDGVESKEGLLAIIRNWVKYRAVGYSEYDRLEDLILNKWNASQSRDSSEVSELEEKIKTGKVLIGELSTLLNKIENELKASSVSSAVSLQPQVDAQQNRNLTPNLLGGIDWTELEKYMRFEGKLKGINLSLPLLSKAELEGFDLTREQEALDNLLAAQITRSGPSDDRLLRYLGAVFQKGEFSQRQIELLGFSQQLCDFLDAKGLETSPAQQAFIVIADTGLYSIRQGSLTQHSPN